MDGWSDAEARTWLAMDLLAPVHDLWALEVAPGPGGEAPPAVQTLTEGLLGEHRPELTEAALAGLLDLERALVVGAALEMARRLVEPDVLALVECALVDEACRLPLLPLVNAAADLLVELERDAVQNHAPGQGGAPNAADARVPVLADAPASAADDAGAAPTREDATDGDDRPRELQAVAWTLGPQGSSSPEGAWTSAGPLGEDVARERRGTGYGSGETSQQQGTLPWSARSARVVASR